MIDSYVRIFSLHMYAYVSASYDDCFVKIWATCENFLGKWFTAPLAKNCPYAYAYKVQNFSGLFGKIPVRVLLDVLLCVQVSKASFCALTSSFTTFQNFVAILTLRHTEGLPWQFCNFTCEITI